MGELDLLIIDGNNLACRNFFKLSTLTNKKGEGTSAIFGTLRSLHSLIEEFKPARCIISWDYGHSPKRIELYPSYKEGKGAMDSDIHKDYIRQLNEIQNFINYFPIFQLKYVNTESDDIIASLCGIFKDITKMIVSTDKDFLQLIDEKTDICIPNKKVETLDSFRKNYCFAPALIADLLSLTGDSSDSINGISGIGFKRACDLIQKYGSFSEMIKEEENKDKFLKLVKENKMLVERNLQLIKLEKESISWKIIANDLLIGCEEYKKLSPLKWKEFLQVYFLRQGFLSFLKDLDKWISTFQSLSDSF